MTIRYKTWTANEILTAADLISYAENNGAVQITATAELDSLDANVNLAFCTYDWTLYQRTAAGTGAGKFTAVKSLSETLTNKTLTSPTISSPTLSGTAAGAYTLGGTPTINGATINAASTIGGISGTTIAGWTGAWTAWTPAMTQGAGSVSINTDYAKYLKIGRTVMGQMRVSVTGAGSSGAPIVVTLPFPAATSGLYVGHGSYFKAGTGDYQAGAYTWTTNAVALVQADVVTSSYMGNFFAAAANDGFYASFVYEAAS